MPSGRLLAAQLASVALQKGLSDVEPAATDARAPGSTRLRRLFSRSTSTLRSSQTSSASASSASTSHGPVTPADSVVDLPSSLGAVPPVLRLSLDMQASLLLDLDFGPALKTALVPDPPRPTRQLPPLPTPASTPELTPADGETDSYGSATEDEADTPSSTVGRQTSVRRRNGVKYAASAFALTDSEDEEDGASSLHVDVRERGRARARARCDGRVHGS